MGPGALPLGRRNALEVGKAEAVDAWFWLKGSFVGLLPPIYLGWELSKRPLKETHPLARGAVALSLGLSTSLLLVNFFYRWQPLELSILNSLLIQLLAGAMLTGYRFFRAPDVPEFRWTPSRWVWPALLLIYLFTASQQIINPDDDYWIHTPLQGLMVHGNFPPFNPFFSDIPMNGHYGRNLSIITVSWLSGWDIFWCQHVMTCLVQMLTFVLLLLALEHWNKSRLQSLLGTAMIYFGINAGGRGGLMDTLQNNNAFVHLYFALLLYLWVKLLRENSLLVSLVMGLILGGYAIVYETHFGLAGLSLAACAPLLWLMTGSNDVDKRLPSRPRIVALVFLSLAVAVPMAATQGGPITNIVQRRLAGVQEVKPDSLSKGMQNQSQVVKITFPKKDLFQILLENGEYQRISCVYYADSVLKYFYTPSPGRGYRSIFSWDVIKIQFLPLYLCPLTGWLMWRRRHLAGWWLWSWGLISYLIPALVDFGPIYESEYFRWQFSSGLGFAGALGISLAIVWQETRERELDWTYDITPKGLLLDIRRGGWAQFAILAILYFDTVGCQQFIKKRWAELPRWGGLWSGAISLPDSRDWLKLHAVLDFDPIDWRAARWLETQVRPGQRVLTNFKQENNFSILFESTLTGVCGARCVGHALPLDDEAIGTTPYHQSAPASAFWQPFEKDGLKEDDIFCDPQYLEHLKADWVYFVPRRPKQRLLAGPSLELLHTEIEGGGQRQVYRFKGLPATVAISKVADSLKDEHPAIERLKVKEHARAGSACPIEVQLSPYFQEQFPADAVIKLRPVRLSSKGSADEKIPSEIELLTIPVHPDETVPSVTPSGRAGQPKNPVQLSPWLPKTSVAGASRLLEFPWTAPFEAGKYELRFSLAAKDGEKPLDCPKTIVAVDFNDWLKALEPVAAEPQPSKLALRPLEIKPKLPVYQPGQLIEANFLLNDANAAHSYPDLRVRGCLTAVIVESEEAISDDIHRGEAHGDVYLLPGVDVQDLALAPEAAADKTQGPAASRYRVDLCGQAPTRPGRYRMDLFLSPEHGKLFRYPGFMIEVKPQ